MKSATVLCMFLFVLGASPVYAVPHLASLTFDGFLNDETILTYYMGGFGSLGSGPGPAFGITFTPGLVADPTPIFFRANRAHHRHIGDDEPGFRISWPSLVLFHWQRHGVVLLRSKRERHPA